jgi:hypothetical protein
VLNQNKINKMKKIYITLMLLTLFSFKVADYRSIYHIPLEAKAVCATDYDLDGDNDIIIEHGIGSQTQWGGIYMMENDGYGHFSFMDSVFDSTGGTVIYADTILSNTYPDIIYSYGGYVKILTNENGNYTISRFLMGPHLTFFNIGDIDNNSHIDVVFISNWERYWGVIYNQGDSSFTAPVYYDVDYPPTDIACGDLNDDGRDDVVVAGASCEIYFSTESGFEMQQLQDNAFNVKIADMDNDGDMDIITFSDAYIMSFVHLYENLGNNVFDTVNNFNINEGCASFFVTDFNNDSLPDALFSIHYHNGGYLLYYNQGDFQFGEPQTIDITNYGEARRNTYCADMDGNSYVDIIITRLVFDTTIAPSLLEILFNDGQGNFVDNPLTATEELQSQNKEGLNCYPNPFINKINFECSAEENAHVMLSIYDIGGKLIKDLTLDPIKTGRHNSPRKNLKFIWDGKNNNGQYCKPCLYIAALKINGAIKQTVKLLKY